MNILIAYASVHGSTAEIAHFIGKVLKERGHAVTVASVGLVESVREYDAVLLGSAIHTGLLLREMRGFIRRFQAELESKPIFLWITCIRILEPLGYQYALGNYIPHDLVDKLPIWGIQVFAGKLTPENLDYTESWTLALRYDGAQPSHSFKGDFRNWEHIREWTGQVSEQLEKAKIIHS